MVTTNAADTPGFASALMVWRQFVAL